MTTPVLPPSASEKAYAASMPYAPAFVPAIDLSAYQVNEKLYVQELAKNVAKLERFTEPNADALNAESEKKNAAFLYSMWGLATSAKNANDYLKTTTRDEMDRIERIDRGTQKQIYKTKHLAMQAEYLVNYYTFVTRVLILTLGVTVLALTIVYFGTPGNVRTVLIMLLVVIYFVILVWMFRTYAYRRRFNNWTQVYWAPGAVVSRDLGKLTAGCR